MYCCIFCNFTKAFSLLANHMMSNMKIRKNEQRRDALLARLNVDAEQLLGKRQNTEIQTRRLINCSIISPGNRTSEIAEK